MVDDDRYCIDVLTQISRGHHRARVARLQDPRRARPPLRRRGADLRRRGCGARQDRGAPGGRPPLLADRGAQEVQRSCGIARLRRHARRHEVGTARAGFGPAARNDPPDPAHDSRDGAASPCDLASRSSFGGASLGSFVSASAPRHREPLQRVQLQRPHPLARHADPAGDRVQRERLAVAVQAVAEPQHLLLTLGEPADRVVERVPAELDRDLRLRASPRRPRRGRGTRSPRPRRSACRGSSPRARPGAPRGPA